MKEKSKKVEFDSAKTARRLSRKSVPLKPSKIHQDKSKYSRKVKQGRGG